MNTALSGWFENPIIQNFMFSGERNMLFNLLIQLQNGRLHEPRSTSQTNLIRSSIRRLRESMLGEATTKTNQSEASPNLALSYLLACDDDDPLKPKH